MANGKQSQKGRYQKEKFNFYKINTQDYSEKISKNNLKPYNEWEMN